MLTIERLREALHYDPETGVFTWRYQKGRGRLKEGTIAGSIPRGSKGYRLIGLDGKVYKAHRLAWFYVHGVWPKGQVDHEDTDKKNNPIGNLREATNSFNMQNRRTPRKDNKSGFLGVSPRGVKWHAQIKVKGRVLHLGYFTTPEAAHKAYVKAKREHHAGGTL